MKKSSLYLFDIDGTLVDTGGAGMTALQQTARQVFGHDGPALDLAGSTDLGIVQQVFTHFNQTITDEGIELYFSTYLTFLEKNLYEAHFGGKALAGAHALLDRLAAEEDAYLGLLTGNIAQGAAAKMRCYQMDHHFPIGAFGCDFADRNLLGPVALDRANQHYQMSFTPADVWVIGDTPKDIACAHAFGAKCLAVSTGHFTAEQLKAAGADRVLDSLTQANFS